MDTKIFFFLYVVCLTPILLSNEKIVSMKELKSKVQLLFYFWKDSFPSTPSTTPPPNWVVNTSLVTLVEDTALQIFYLLPFISQGTLPLGRGHVTISLQWSKRNWYVLLLRQSRTSVQPSSLCYSAILI